jgi:environmental stress-induced protein Ves
LAVLRISVAEITRDGPFSAFAGVQRWFAVLEGAGVMLRAGRPAIER